MSKQGCCVDKACNPKTCMQLPQGKTCGDCYYIKQCKAFCGHKESDDYCDFFPRKFVDKNHPLGV